MIHRPRPAQLATAAVLALAASTAGAQSASPAPSAATQAQLLQRLDALANELDSVKAELKKMQQEQAATNATVQATAATVASSSAATTAPAGAGAPPTVLSSYAEINYTRPRKNTSATQTDVARFVLGYQHRFNEQTKVAAELEVEHAVSSSTDSGEVEVEQAYVEHQLNQTFGLRGGLFLIPLGMLNTNHEPTAFYGVQRNAVETAIIPSTWREAGLQVFGEHDNGVSWAAGLSTGFNLSKWDATSSEARTSPLRTIHQEGQNAASKDLSAFGTLDWRGVPGLRLGGGLFTGKVGQGQPGFAELDKARLTVWDLHAKWTPGPWDFSAVYANGSITGAGDFNTLNTGNVSLVPRSFDGWYLQGAYTLRLGGDYLLAPFGRLERINTGRGFDGLVAGSGNADAYPTEQILTLGANFNVAPGVVIKADVRRHKVDSDADSFNLGLGYSF